MACEIRWPLRQLRREIKMGDRLVETTQRVKLRQMYQKDTPWHTMAPGTTYTLSHLHKTEDNTVQWIIDGLLLKNCVQATFAVHKGPRPATDFGYRKKATGD